MTNLIEGVDVQNRHNAENDVFCMYQDTRSEHHMHNLKEAMSTSDVAEILGVTERTVRNMCKNKQITHYRIGSKIVITKTDLDNYIESLKVEKEN